MNDNPCKPKGFAYTDLLCLYRFLLIQSVDKVSKKEFEIEKGKKISYK